jgi:hypothetical protein
VPRCDGYTDLNGNPQAFPDSDIHLDTSAYVHTDAAAHPHAAADAYPATDTDPHEYSPANEHTAAQHDAHPGQAAGFHLLYGPDAPEQGDGSL